MADHTVAEPVDAEVQTLADVLTDARLRGIYAGSWTLARWLLDAGYRRVAEPAPDPGMGRCRVCHEQKPLIRYGEVAAHDDDRGHCCPGGLLTPERGW